MRNSRIERDLPGHVPELDALRGIAVLAVVASHLHSIVSTDPFFRSVTSWTWVNQLLSRGFLGVDLFFVLSGFLITSLLLRDKSTKPSSTLHRFYLRRALRLLPALYALLLASFLIALLENFPMEFQWNSTWRALLFISNWGLRSIFLRTQDDIGHTWSLAVEEQFYLVWPLIFVAVRRLRLHWTVAMAVPCLIAGLVATYRAALWNSGELWLFIYPQTITRVDGILVGCICAYVYRYLHIPSIFLRILGYSSTALIVVLSYVFGEPSRGFLYQGGFTVVALLFGIVVLASATDPSFGTQPNQSRILRWCGQRSYGLYLWHFPIFRLFSRHIHVGPDYLRIVLALLASFGATQLSWKFIERPFLKIKEGRFSSHPTPL